LRLIMRSMVIHLLNSIGLTNYLRRDDKVNCYLCGKPLKENEIIPYQERQICDECEYRLEVDY
jgi:recombinational DNA repair protein (RecF pathway)